MSNKKKNKKLLSGLPFFGKKANPYKEDLSYGNIKMHWRISLVISLVLSTTLIVWSYLWFSQIADDSIFRESEAGDTGVTEVNPEDLRATIEYFEEKERTFVNLQQNRLQIPNPSSRAFLPPEPVESEDSTEEDSSIETESNTE